MAEDRERGHLSLGVNRGDAHRATEHSDYSIVLGKVSGQDLETRILHLMGIDARQLSFRCSGLDQRLIGPTGEGQVVKGILE